MTPPRPAASSSAAPEPRPPTGPSDTEHPVVLAEPEAVPDALAEIENSQSDTLEMSMN